MRTLALTLAAIGSSLAITSADAAGRTPTAPPGGAGAAQSAPRDPANSTAPSVGQTNGDSPGAVLMSTPTIQPRVGDDQLNLRRTIIRLPF
jgi:hypothetical protein